MRLFLVTSLGMTAILCLPYGLYAVTLTWRPVGKVADWAATPAAHGINLLARLGRKIMELAPVESRCFEVGNWLDCTFDIQRWHWSAVVFGEMCEPCLDLAPGWWEIDVDCAEHRCGKCMTCTDRLDEVPSWRMPSAGHRSGH